MEKNNGSLAILSKCNFPLISLFRCLFAHVGMKPGVERYNFLSLFETLKPSKTD